MGRPFPSVIIAEQNGVIYVTTKHHIEGIPDTYTVNDCGYIDSDGYLMFHGRRGDVINKGGYKISIPEMDYIYNPYRAFLKSLLLRLMMKYAGKILLLIWY